MADLIFDSALSDEATGAIDYDTDTFYVMLLTSAATPVASWSKRSDVTNEVSGTGYTAGGNAVTVSVTPGNPTTISLGGTSWPSSTITARYAVYYKSRGGVASADELVAVNDFGADVSSSNGTFTLNASTINKSA